MKEGEGRAGKGLGMEQKNEPFEYRMSILEIFG